MISAGSIKRAAKHAVHTWWAANLAKDHPKEAKELAAKVLKDKCGNPDLAKYWKGFGVRELS